jgi:hypothetical protein
MELVENSQLDDLPLIKTVIDPNEDLLLVLSSDFERHNILVSLKSLSLASKVFRALFSSHFKEGNEMATR